MNKNEKLSEKALANGQNILYRVRSHRRSKSIKITIESKEMVVISKPIFVPTFVAEQFLKEHLQWVKTQIQKLNETQTAPLFSGTEKEYRQVQQEAKTEITRIVQECNQIYQFRFERISIRNQKSRWGSCSAKKNLNFNYRVFFLPEHLKRYIATHELCHLQEMNHSPMFWNLVEQTLPSYKQLKKELRTICFR